MVGFIHFEATEKGGRIQTHLSDVSDFDKFCIMCMLKRSLGISKEEFEFANVLIQADLDKLVMNEKNTTGVSISPEVLQVIEKLKGNNNDEG